MQKYISRLLFLKSIRKRNEVNKCEVVEHKQLSEKVRSHRFCPHMLDRNYKGIIQKKIVC